MVNFLIYNNFYLLIRKRMGKLVEFAPLVNREFCLPFRPLLWPLSRFFAGFCTPFFCAPRIPD